MPTHARRPRPGRVLDVLIVTTTLFVFVGLAVYHYRRLERGHVNPDRIQKSTDTDFGAREFAGYEWPQWRGPNRDGVSTETGILREWPAAGPKVLWEKKTGEGFASVAVVRGRLFTIFQDGDNESVVAWDAETGKEYWRFSYPCHYKNKYGNGPRSTPSVDGDFLYTVGATGLMHCLKAFTDEPKGELVWRKDLLAEFGARAPKWGVAFSPLVEGDRVFVMPGGPAGNSLAALDRLTGAILWKKHDDVVGYSSPIVATIHGQRQVLFLTGSRLVSVHPDNGDQLWDYPWPIQENCNIATPIVEKNYVFISSGYGKGCVKLEIDRDGAAWTPALVFVNNRMRNHFSTCVRRKDHLYGFDDTVLKCMNFHTGKVDRSWRAGGFDKGSVLLVNDLLIIYGANGMLALAEADPKEYIEKSSFRFSNQGESCWSVPVVSKGLLYVRDQEKLVCFDVRGPDWRW